MLAFCVVGFLDGCGLSDKTVNESGVYSMLDVVDDPTFTQGSHHVLLMWGILAHAHANRYRELKSTVLPNTGLTEKESRQYCHLELVPTHLCPGPWAARAVFGRRSTSRHVDHVACRVRRMSRSRAYPPLRHTTIDGSRKRSAQQHAFHSVVDGNY